MHINYFANFTIVTDLLNGFTEVYMLFFAGISLTEINPRSTTVPEDRQ
jgi:hypothetical protein